MERRRWSDELQQIRSQAHCAGAVSNDFQGADYKPLEGDEPDLEAEVCVGGGGRMLNLLGNSYEEQRTDFFKEKIEKAESRMTYWSKRVNSHSEEWRNMAAYERASDAGWEYSFYSDALNALAVQPTWISPGEQMPEKNTAVIVAFDDGHVFQALYTYDGWDLWEGCTGNIIAWMPLPEPPKEVE